LKEAGQEAKEPTDKIVPKQQVRKLGFKKKKTSAKGPTERKKA